MATIGDNLRRIRTARGLSVLEASRLVGVSQRAFWELEDRQESAVRQSTILRYAEGLGISPDELTRDVVTPDPIRVRRPTSLQSVIALRMIDARQRAGLSQLDVRQQLRRRRGRTKTHRATDIVGKVEAGFAMPTLETLYMIASIIGVELTDLLPTVEEWEGKKWKR